MRRRIDRWTQYSLFMAGIIWSAAWAHRALLPMPGPNEVKPGGETFDLRVVASLVLFAIGIAGVYSARASRTGRLGAVGVRLVFAGVALMATWVYELHDLYPVFVLGGLSILAGSVLFVGVAVQAKALTAAAAVPLIVGSLLFLAASPDDWRAFLAVPLGAAWMWLALSERKASSPAAIPHP